MFTPTSDTTNKGLIKWVEHISDDASSLLIRPLFKYSSIYKALDGVPVIIDIIKIDVMYSL